VNRPTASFFPVGLRRQKPDAMSDCAHANPGTFAAERAHALPNTAPVSWLASPAILEDRLIGVAVFGLPDSSPKTGEQGG
jgi:hypothetical protein